MAHLPPVGVDHVGGGGHHGGLAELGHDLPAGEAVLGAAGVLHVGQHRLEQGSHLQRLLQTPGPVGVQVHPGIGEGLLDGGHGFGLVEGGEHAALELEVLKAVLVVGGSGQSHDGLRGQSLLVAETIPVTVGVGLFLILQIGLFPVAYVEEIAEEAHPMALDTVAHERGGGHVQILAQQVQQGGLHGGYHVDAGAQVIGLQAPDVVLDVVAQPLADGVERLLVIGDPGAQHQRLHRAQGVGDLLPAGDLSHALGAGGVGEDDHVAGEIGRVGPGQVQLHAVVAGHREHFHFGDDRNSHVSLLLTIILRQTRCSCPRRSTVRPPARTR